VVPEGVHQGKIGLTIDLLGNMAGTNRRLKRLIKGRERRRKHPL